MIVLVMGVTGSGKTTLAKALAAAFGWAFQEGDDLHPQANIDKMRAGVPLSDADRYPWLDDVKSWIDDKLAQGGSGVISCSALKRGYRGYLGLGREGIALVYIGAARAVIAERLAGRPAHFMPALLLGSQLDILEPPRQDEKPIIVDAEMTTEAQLAIVKRHLCRRRSKTPAQ